MATGIPGRSTGMPVPAGAGLWQRFVRGLEWFNTATGYLSGVVIVVCTFAPLRFRPEPSPSVASMRFDLARIRPPVRPANSRHFPPPSL